jgi:hypothetical protein
VKLFTTILEAKGFLHFYGSEYLKVTRVSDVLHNWALMFALNDVHPDPTKRHLENLRGANFYCTPALPVETERRIYKRNPVPEDTGAGKMGLMEIEYYLPGSRFALHVLSRDGSPPPGLIHFGKKRAPCQLSPDRGQDWPSSEVFLKDYANIPVRPSHLVNPLDYEAISDVSYAKKLPMNPSPLYYLSGKFAKVLVAERVGIVVPNIQDIDQWN